VRHAVARALAVVLGTLLCVLFFGPGMSHAAGEAVQGTLRNEGAPVTGVSITAEGSGGFSEQTTSGADGTWEIPVPGAGAYTVTIDEDSLPEGVALRNADRTSLETTVAVGQQKTVLFALGEGTRQTTGTAGQALQLTVEGIRFGLILALGAVGLSLIFGTTGLTNFAHGELITLGALVAYLFNVPFGIPLIPAAILTLIVCGLAAGLLDLTLWRRLRKRGTGLIAMMIVSIGLSLLVRYFYLYLFGGANRSYGDYAGQGGLSFGPVSLTPKDIVAMVVSIVVLLLVSLALLKTRIGKATRAVSDNPALAAASGIDVERVIQVVWVAGGVLAGLSGILLALSQQVSFQLGFQVLLLVFAAVTLGGLGTAFGALAGSMVVGLFINVSTLIIPSELKNVGALGILIVILLVRPQGLLGRSERVG
jgi:branched-chain amino acid transport system permease protein